MSFSPDRLRGHRHGCQFSQADLAAAAGLTPERYALIESRMALPSHRELLNLTEALDVPMAEIYGQRDTPAADYAHAVLRHASVLGPEDIQVIATVLREIQSNTRVGRTITQLDAS